MKKSWLIGSDPSCDVVVAADFVSGVHCRVTEVEDGFEVEDVGSSNGTYLDGVRLNGPAKVARGAAVTLGKSTPLPWPDGRSRRGSFVWTVGRAPSNDVVRDDPVVSSRHARFVWDPSTGEGWVEDAGSANGTAVGSPSNKVKRARVSPSDVIYLGGHALPAAELFERVRPAPPARPGLVLEGDEMAVGRTADNDLVVDLPMVSSRHALLFRRAGRVWLQDLESANGTFVNGTRLGRDAVALSPGDTLGFGSHERVYTGEKADRPTSTASASSPGGPGTALWLVAGLPVLCAAVLGAAGRSGAGAPVWAFALGLWALATGLVDAWFLDRRRAGGRAAEADFSASDWFLGAGLAAVQAAAGWSLAAAISGVPSSWPAGAAFAMLGAGVGLPAGISAVSLTRGRFPAAPALAGLLAAFGLLGVGVLPDLGVPGGPVMSQTSPARWAYEGFWLSALDPDDPSRASAGIDPGVQSGPQAAATALVLMAVGAAAVAVFIASERRGQETRPSPSAS